MSARAEVLCDGTIGCEKALGMAWRLEPLPLPLPLAGWLVRILRAVVKIAVRTMFHPRGKLSFGGAVALQLIGDDHTRCVRQPFEELAEELLCCLLIPAPLH